MMVFIGKLFAEYSQMSIRVPGFQSFSGFLHPFVLAKSATSSIRIDKAVPFSLFQKLAGPRIIMIATVVTQLCD